MSEMVSVKKVMAFGYLRLVIEYQGAKYAIIRHIRCSGDLKHNTPAAPPFVTKTIKVNWRSSVDKSSLGQRTAELRNQSVDEMRELAERMTALCHQLGFDSFRLRIVPGSASEYFISQRSAIVGIPVIYELQIQTGFPLHALADAFGRRSFIFVRLNSENQDNWPLPVYANVSKMLSEWRDSKALATISDNDFAIRYKGLVCSLDVNGYGRLLQASQGNVTANKKQVQNTVRSEVIRLTSKLLWRLRLPPHQITGDGALFCLPDDNATFNALCLAYIEEVCNPLEQWNKQISDGEASGLVAGSRLVVTCDDFHYGRIAGADSVMPGIDGQSLIDVVRLDSGFKTFLNSTPHEERHFFVSPGSFEHSGLVGEKDSSKVFKYETKESRSLEGRYTPVKTAR